jgi:hypothetical protein
MIEWWREQLRFQWKSGSEKKKGERKERGGKEYKKRGKRKQKRKTSFFSF